VTGGGYHDSGEYDGGLSRVRAELREMAEADGEPPEGRGEAANGMVVVAAKGGRISTVELHPKVMRLPSQDLAEEFAKAANAALADLEAKYPELSAGNIDPAALERQLAEVQDQGTRQMRRYMQTLTDALAQIGR